MVDLVAGTHWDLESVAMGGTAHSEQTIRWCSGGEAVVSLRKKSNLIDRWVWSLTLIV